MSIRVDTSILNQNGTPAFNANALPFRPPAGYVGRIFISTNTQQIFRDEGTGWNLIADAGGGSSNLQQVTANGNYTPYGINITSGGLYLLGSVNGGIFFADGGSGQFTQDATTLFWDNTNKRLGLGTATPGARLDIHSGTGTNATFNGTGVTNAVTTYQSAGASKWSLGNYVSSAVANDFCIYDNVNTAYRFYIHNTGVINIPTSLIIGSTTPTSSYTLDLTGSAKISSNLTLGLITQGSVLFAGASGLLSQNNSQFFWDNTNNRLGINTNSPLYSLDVTGTGRFTSNVGVNSTLSAWNSLFSVIDISTTASFAGSSSGSANMFNNAYYNGTNYIYKTSDYAFRYLQGGGIHSWYVAPSGTAGNAITFTQAMTITSSGNIGIGTPSPSGVLSIVRDGASTYTNTIWTNANSTANLSIGVGGSSVSAVFLQNNAYVINNNASALILGTNDTERMRITSGGNLLIGASSSVSDNRLYVKGSTSNTSSYAVIMQNSSNTDLFYINNVGTTYINGSTTIGSLGTGTVTATSGTLSTVSDMNLKNEDGFIDNALDKVLNLKPRYFHWKEESGLPTDIRQLGFYAQEVNQALGEEAANTPKNENDKWGIYDRGIIAMLTKAIQELNEKLVRNNIN
jgi:Chaperone of endosialidase